MDIYHVIGLMSGTSLDGVDIAYCVFKLENKKWNFEIREATTIPYNTEWKGALASLSGKSAFEFVSVHEEYGRYLGQLVKEFVSKHKIKVDFVSSHGHTIFHQPDKGITAQIGSGASLAAACGLPVVYDFRSLDVALGGQGAPLVPVGDHYLFSEYEYCLNIGGIANISFSRPTEQSFGREKKTERVAYDVCPANMVLNELSQKEGLSFDANGDLARKGKISETLLKELNALEYYSLPYPKSLGKEWVDNYFFPVLERHSLSTRDKLNTCCEHIAIKVAEAVKTEGRKGSVYITGGGAFNKFLIERIASHLSSKIILPEATLINHKEALIFAFLGVLRKRDEVNCFKSVTGAMRDSCCGAIYLC